MSPLERRVMAVIWARGECSVAQVQRALSHRYQDSTVRTVLHRLERKGMLDRRSAGRHNLYTARVEASAHAVAGVREIVKHMLGGSMEALLRGMVDNEAITARELRELARRVSAARPEGDRR